MDVAPRGRNDKGSDARELPRIGHAATCFVEVSKSQSRRTAPKNPSLAHETSPGARNSPARYIGSTSTRTRMAYQTIALTVADRVATVMMNRPDKLNALNAEMIEELGVAVAEIRDRAGIGGGIFTGGRRGCVVGAGTTESQQAGGNR